MISCLLQNGQSTPSTEHCKPFCLLEFYYETLTTIIFHRKFSKFVDSYFYSSFGKIMSLQRRQIAKTSEHDNNLHRD